MNNPIATWSATAMVLTATLGVAARAYADLTPGEVLLVWNSADTESSAIADAYLAAYDFQVRSCDIALPENPPVDCENPDPDSSTRFYITPEAYETEIRTVVQACLDTYPEVIAIVTTRGVPSTISSDFCPPAGGHNCCGVLSSVESALAALGAGLLSLSAPAT